jgi:hypothetical protein
MAFRQQDQFSSRTSQHRMLTKFVRERCNSSEMSKKKKKNTEAHFNYSTFAPNYPEKRKYEKIKTEIKSLRANKHEERNNRKLMSHDKEPAMSCIQPQDERTENEVKKKLGGRRVLWGHLMSRC